MSGINARKQTINTIVIIAGIGLLLYDFIAKPEVIYFKISGLIILMFGLYKSTQQWTSDNKVDEVSEDGAPDKIDNFDEDIDLDDENIKQNEQ